jgi:hypothetical protein
MNAPHFHKRPWSPTAFEVKEYIQTADCSGALKYSSAGFGIEVKRFNRISGAVGAGDLDPLWS